MKYKKWRQKPKGGWIRATTYHDRASICDMIARKTGTRGVAIWQWSFRNHISVDKLKDIFVSVRYDHNKQLAFLEALLADTNLEVPSRH